MREKKAEGQVEVSPDKAILLFQEHDKYKALHMYTPCCPSTPLRIRQGLPHCPCLNYQWVRLWQSCCCLRLLIHCAMLDERKAKGTKVSDLQRSNFRNTAIFLPTNERTNLWLSTQYLPTGMKREERVVGTLSVLVWRLAFGVWRLVDRKLRE